MSTLTETEQAAAALPPQQKQELMVFLAAQMRAEGAQLPEPRKFSRERIQGWIAEDEAAADSFKRKS
jgi:hypothetical protein